MVADQLRSPNAPLQPFKYHTARPACLLANLAGLRLSAVWFYFLLCVYFLRFSVCVCVLIRVRESSGACRGVVVANAGSCRDAIAIRLLQNSGVRLVCLQEMPDLQRNAPPSDDLTHRVSVLLWLLVDRGKLGGTTVPPGETEA